MYHCVLSTLHEKHLSRTFFMLWLMLLLEERQYFEDTDKFETPAPLLIKYTNQISLVQSVEDITYEEFQKLKKKQLSKIEKFKFLKKKILL